MRLLLLLSALLSALTGVNASAHAPGAAQAIAGRSVAVPSVAPARRIAHRPLPAVPALSKDAVAVVAPQSIAVAAEPLWASRPRV